MPNPLIDAKAGNRSALLALEDHPGYWLFIERLRELLQDDFKQLARLEGLQEIGRAQGAVTRLSQIVGDGRYPSLLKRMLDENEVEQKEFENEDPTKV